MLKKVSRAVRIGVCVGAMSVIGVSVANAGTASDTFQVTATVIASCGIVANDLAFGNYDPVSATPTDATTTLDVTCTNGAAYNITLDGGANNNASNRRMKNVQSNTPILNYSLAKDTPGGVNWGDTSATGLAGVGTGSVQNITVHGRIAAQQGSVIAGAHVDTITATVSF